MNDENAEPRWINRGYTIYIDAEKERVAKLEEENKRLKEENRALLVKNYLDSLN